MSRMVYGGDDGDIRTRISCCQLICKPHTHLSAFVLQTRNKNYVHECDAPKLMYKGSNFLTRPEIRISSFQIKREVTTQNCVWKKNDIIMYCT